MSDRKPGSAKPRNPMDARKSIRATVTNTENKSDTQEFCGQSAPDKIAYNITGDRRKALVESIENYIGERAIYKNAPTFEYRIGSFTIDKNGTLYGPIDHSLIQWLTNEGFRA